MKEYDKDSLTFISAEISLLEAAMAVLIRQKGNNQGRWNGFCLGGSEYYERDGADRNPRIYFINPQF